jgi:glycosyltransferase involved in cell wall biosynthesis
LIEKQKKKFRLTVIIGSLDRGGAERHLLLVLPRLIHLGFSVTVYCLSARGELASEMEAQGVQVVGEVGRPAKFGQRYLRVLLRVVTLFLYLVKHRPEIVHFFLPAAYILGTPVAIASRRLIRIMSRQNNYQQQLFGSAFIERQWHRRMSAVLANSVSVTDQLRSEGVQSSKLHLIYNGVDLSAFGNSVHRDVARNRLGLSSEALVFVVVANLIPYKGHADLLQALSIAKSRLPENWVLLCAGRDDGIGSSLQDMVEKLGLTQRVHWLGSVKDIPLLLAAADIALLTSHEEGFSNAIIEYMATGLPVIVTNVGGNAEAVQHGVTGLVVPPKEPSALADAILSMVLNPDRRKAMGIAAQQVANERYSLDVCVESYVNLYRKALHDHGML